MRIDEALDTMERLWPGTFTEAKRDYWERSYAKHLTPGPNLQVALDRCIEEMGPGRKSPPKPADIAKHYPADPANESTYKPDNRAWADKMNLGTFGHDAVRAEPSYCRELYVWALDNPGLMPSLEDVAEFRRAAVSFAESFAHIKAGRMPDGNPIPDAPRMRFGRQMGKSMIVVMFQAAVNMEAREGQLWREHVKGCGICR